MMTFSLPSGTVTFLFTDIEGSTKLAQQYPDEMPTLIARHNEILSRAIQARNGFVFRVVGDSFSAAFYTASEALNAALDVQRGLHKEAWTPAPIKVRMGINTGAANALREMGGTPMTPDEQVYFDEQFKGLCEKTKDDEFKKGWENGRVMTMEQAIAFALGE